LLGAYLEGRLVAGRFNIIEVETGAPPTRLMRSQRARRVERIAREIGKLDLPSGSTKRCLLVFHLMIAGRLHWKRDRRFLKLAGRVSGARQFYFEMGRSTLVRGGGDEEAGRRCTFLAGDGTSRA